jgi:hypothetical protein
MSATLLAGCGGGSEGEDDVPVVPGPIQTPTPTAPPAPAPTPGPAIEAPANQTVSVGQSGFFEVRASGVTGYQWLRDGSPIDGATSANYLTPSATAGDTGARFSVRVQTTSGTTTSAAATLTVNPNSDGSAPAAFWGDLASTPAATRVATLRFLNRTNGRYPDAQLFWRLQGRSPDGGQIEELHSFAETPTFDMPSIGSARMYFFIAPSAAAISTGATDYYDFIELNAGRSSADRPYTFNVNTTRVDAFGLKTAIRLRCANLDQQRGEDYGTFLEDRAITFAKYSAEVPTEFQQTATLRAPYRIVEPGAAGFGPNGQYASYWRTYVDQVYAANGIDQALIPKPTAPLNFAGPPRPDLEAAIARHVADRPGTFKADGTLVDPNFWRTTAASSFYGRGPANYYARYWNAHGIGGYAYGFPYDDAGGHSSYLSCLHPQQLPVAIGW